MRTTTKKAAPPEGCSVGHASEARRFLLKGQPFDRKAVKARHAVLRDRLRALVAAGTPESDPEVRAIREEFVSTCVHLACKVAHGVGPGLRPLTGALLALANAGRLYDPDRSTFSTYAWRSCYKGAIRELTEGKRIDLTTNFAPIDGLACGKKGPSENYDGPSLDELYSRANMDMRARSIVTRIAVNGQTFVEVARFEGISKQRVEQLYSRARARLRRAAASYGVAPGWYPGHAPAAAEAAGPGDSTPGDEVR